MTVTPEMISLGSAATAGKPLLSSEELIAIYEAMRAVDLEFSALKHDLGRQMKIANTYVNEAERLREALEEIAKVGVGAGSDWSDHECSDYWAAIVSRNRRTAREAVLKRVSEIDEELVICDERVPPDNRRGEVNRDPGG